MTSAVYWAPAPDGQRFLVEEPVVTVLSNPLIVHANKQVRLERCGRRI